MAINVIVPYNDRSLPANLLLIQVPIFLWFDGTMHYYSMLLLLCYVRWLCVAINVRVQYKGVILPDIMMLTQGYYHQGTRLIPACSDFVFTTNVTVYYYYYYV